MATYSSSREKQSKEGFEKYFGKKPKEQQRVVSRLKEQREKRERGSISPNLGAEEASISRLRQEDARAQIAKQVLDAHARSESRPAYESFIPFSGLFGAGQDMAAQIMGKRFMNMLNNPLSTAVVNPASGRVTGVRDEFGRLTGYDQEQILANMVNKANTNEPEQQAVPPNPVTGQCPAGYTYDANAQACMPIFNSQVPTSFNYEAYTPAQTLLDQPSGLLDVDPMFGQPMDFNYGMPRVRLI